MRIWFNRGFSLGPIAAAMRAADPTLDVFTSVGQRLAYHAGPTGSWPEPDIDKDDDAAYVDWARERIAANRIDVFIPTRKRGLFDGVEMGCRVELPAARATLDLLDDKFAFAESVKAEPYHLDTRLITSAAELTEGLAAFATPCVKPRHGVNGHGFWRLMPDHPMSHLDDPVECRILDRLYLAAAVEAEAAGTFRELVLMDYLPGPEVSFDMLAHRGTLLKSVARTKFPGEVQHIQSDQPLTPIARDLVTRFGLHGLVNAQFRKAEDGSWRLLEINARAAGGSLYSEQVGAGLIADWAALLTGRKQPGDIRATAIDTQIRLTTAVTQIAA